MLAHHAEVQKLFVDEGRLLILPNTMLIEMKNI
jgi:hypothetical protein